MTRRAMRAAIWIVAGVAGLLAALLAFAAWAVGLGRYGDDYCVRLATTETGSDAPSMAGPMSVRCRYSNGTELVVHDAAPLIWTVVCSIALILALATLVALAWLVTRRRPVVA